MNKNILILIAIICAPLFVSAQYPDVGINCGTVIGIPSNTVDVPITAGANFSNITHLQGTFTYNPAVVSWNSMQSWTISNPGGASFSVSTPGIINFTWTNLISVGPTLTSGALIFNLRFNVIGSIGQTSPINFISGSTVASWNSGWGWSGNNFLVAPGAVNVGCSGPNPSFNPVVNPSNNYNFSFVDASSSPTAWSWDFGDGGTSTVQNPSHTFATAGTYNVCLASTNLCGTDTFCQNVIVCSNMPQANFTNTASNTNAIFTNTSTGAPTSYSWNFGDGTTSTGSGTVIHQFPASGTYNVCLIATNGCGVDTTCHDVTVICPVPQAAWTNTSFELLATFSDQTVNPYSWSWDFGDGATSSSQNPTHTYAAPGTYNVCLVSSNPTCGGDTACQTIEISCPKPNANWTSQINDSAVTFDDNSTIFPTTWLWDFGDGSTSSSQNPVHIYSDTGVFNVCLIAGSLCGSDTLCQTITINWLGLTDLQLNSFKISPNPANEFIQIQNILDVNFECEIHNLQGQKIYSKSVVNMEIVSTQNWERGAYFVSIKNNESVVTKKIILQ